MTKTLRRPAEGFSIEGACTHVGFEPSAGSVQALDAWLTALCTWNAKMDLTAARDVGELVDLMICDAARLASWLPRDASMVDVGTGAGAPGLAVGIMRPDLRVHLVEPLQKRASFLRTMIGSLQLDHVSLESKKGAALVGPGGRANPGWDVACSRATLPPEEWAALGSCLAPRTVVFLAKDEPPLPEGTTVELDAHYTWFTSGATRRILVLDAGGWAA
jgi:16S rRNA (guanine527-N7)-methyltransferase